MLRPSNVYHRGKNTRPTERNEVFDRILCFRVSTYHCLSYLGIIYWTKNVQTICYATGTSCFFRGTCELVPIQYFPISLMLQLHVCSSSTIRWKRMVLSEISKLLFVEILLIIFYEFNFLDYYFSWITCNNI